jgi:hypothetical protein
MNGGRAEASHSNTIDQPFFAPPLRKTGPLSHTEDFIRTWKVLMWMDLSSVFRSDPDQAGSLIAQAIV